MAIVFNNVSKKQSAKNFIEKISTYKELLTEEAVKFYCDEISDGTIIGVVKQFSWKDMKNKVMGKKDYKE